MKRLFFTAAFGSVALFTTAQNVGIGTAVPSKLLSVNGTIVVDHGSANKGGLDSASLLFGANGLTGISSTKTPVAGQHGLDMWTNGIKRFSISESGNTGIGISPSTFKLDVAGTIHNSGSLSSDGNLFVNGYAGIGIPGSPAYKLLVNGDSRIQGDGTYTGSLNTLGNFTASGNTTVNGDILGNSIRSTTTLKADIRAAIGGSIDNSFRLRVYDGNTRLGGDLQATGYTAIGGDVDNNYRLRVYDGNSRFGGDAQVTGNLNAGTITASSLDIDNSLTIAGKGSVRSNGTSPLRIGFDTKAVNIFLNSNEAVSVTANITEFTGGYNDARVILSHVVSDPGSSLLWHKVRITVMGPNDGSDTCTIWLHNENGASGILVGTIYLTTIAKN